MRGLSAALIVATLLGVPAPITLLGAMLGKRAPVVAATPAPAWSANLLQGTTATLTAGTGTWVTQGGTLSGGRDGTLQVTAGGTWALASSGMGPTATPAVPGGVYSGSFRSRASMVGSVRRTVVPYLYFYDAAGLVLAKVKGQAGTDGYSSWTASTAAVAVAPAGTTRVALAALYYGVVPTEVHSLTAPSLVRATRTTPSVVGPLSTRGNLLYDARGPLVLRGLHRFGLEGGATGTSKAVGLTSADVARMRAWGANMVRVSLSQSYWLEGGCSYDSTYRARVDAAVKAVTDLGMVALVDLHWSDRDDCVVGPQKMADLRSVTFWQQAAARYRANPLVMFDLFNEPHDIDDATWLGGGPVTTGSTTWTAVGMQELYDVVRGTGARNAVVVSGNDWANRLPSARVQGTGIVYGVHAYTCPTRVSSSDCAVDPLDPSVILRSWVAAGATIPIAVTEFGWPSPDDGAYVRRVVAYAEQQGWGWTAFAWDGTSTGTFSLTADNAGAPPYQPNATGMAVLEALQR